jgi:hypothetical protein
VEAGEIQRVCEFKYLGRIVSENDDGTTSAIEANLKKAKMNWAIHKTLFLTKEHAASRRVMVHFYKAIVQSIPLYWAETWVINPKNMHWVINPKNMQKLRTFHRKCASYITNRHIKPSKDDEMEDWIFPPSTIDSVLEDIFEIKAYI